MTDAEGVRPAVADRTADGTSASTVVVTAHSTAPGRTVFTERGNADGWIASDLTLALER